MMILSTSVFYFDKKNGTIKFNLKIFEKKILFISECFCMMPDIHRLYNRYDFIRTESVHLGNTKKKRKLIVRC